MIAGLLGSSYHYKAVNVVEVLVGFATDSYLFVALPRECRIACLAC